MIIKRKQINLNSSSDIKGDASLDWKPNTNFNHIKDIYNKVKENGYKFVNNEREEFMSAVHKAHSKAYKPDQCKQIKDWHRDIWQHNRKVESSCCQSIVSADLPNKAEFNNVFDVISDMFEFKSLSDKSKCVSMILDNHQGEDIVKVSQDELIKIANECNGVLKSESINTSSDIDNNADKVRHVEGTLYKVLVENEDEFLLTEYFSDILSYLDNKAQLNKDLEASIFTMSNFTSKNTPYLEYNGYVYRNLDYPNVDVTSVIYRDGECKTVLSEGYFKTPSKSTIKDYVVRLTNNTTSFNDGIIVTPKNETYKCAVKVDSVLHLFDTEEDANSFVDKSPKTREAVSLTASESIKKDNWKIEYNDGAVEGYRKPNEIIEIAGDWNDVLDKLDEIYVEIPSDDGITCPIDTFINDYEAVADLSGSTAVLRIIRNDEVVFEIDDYDEYWSQLIDDDDYDDEDYDDDYEDIEASTTPAYRYFDTSDLLDFADSIASKLSDKYPAQFYIADTYIVDYNRLVIEMNDNYDNIFSESIEIDMDNIDDPMDIYKYQLTALAEFASQMDGLYEPKEGELSDVDSEDVEAASEIDEADVINKLEGELKQRTLQTLTSDRYGFDESDVEDYTVVEVSNNSDDNIRAEVRAELPYNALMDLANQLDAIVTQYDKDAYFEPEVPGILTAYLNKSAVEKMSKLNVI